MFSRETFHGLAPHHSGYPVSRDYESVKCWATGCKYNFAEECAVSTRCEIMADGKCRGFESVPQKQKIDGD